MNVLKGFKFGLTALMLLVSVVVYPVVSLSTRIDTTEQNREALLVPDLGTGLPQVLSETFNTPGEFRFITPIAPNPHDSTANFDDGILPYLTVTVCRVDETECRLIKTFTSRGAMSEQLRIESKPREGSWFVANWHTSSSLDTTAVYRISVDVPDETLGSIDLPPSVYRSWGRTWPIKFIVEKDAALRIRLLSAAGLSIWEIADILRSELGLCGDELSQLLLDIFPNATLEQVEDVVNGVCQNAEFPVTTKIADNATRDSLASFDLASGQMAFALETTVLKNLRVNDIIVSKPGPAAPYGYLRKVTAIRKDRGAYFLETVQASLNEAITRGEVDASGPLEAEEDIAIEPSFRKLDASAEVLPAQFSDGFLFEHSFDETFKFDGRDGDIQGNGEVNVKGYVRFQGGYAFGLGVEPCFDVPPVCVDRFEARAGVNQYSTVDVTGKFNGSIRKEKVLKSKIFNPIVIFIGPFPIVLLPVVDLVVGLDGSARVDFRFAAELSEQLVVGAKWTDPGDGGQGWQNVSNFSLLPQGRVIEANLTADMRIVGYGKGVAKLLFYGAAGPGFGARVGMLVHVQTGQKPLWTIYGHLGAELLFQINFGGLLKLSEFRETILNENFVLAEAANQPPVFSNVRDGAIQARVNTPVFIGPDAGFNGKNYDVSDPEGDFPILSATTSTDGLVNWPRVTYTTPGLKTVKITAMDSEGLSSELYLGIDVRNLPPTVTITPAGGEIPATVQYWLTASAYDPEEGTLRCSRLTWEANGAHTKTVSSSLRSCMAVFKFSNPGPHTVTVTATDSLGATMSKEHHVIVTDPPDTPLPEIEPDSFSIQAISLIRRRGDTELEIGCLPGALCEVEEGDLIYNGYGGDFIPPLIMRLTASDPLGGRVFVQWVCQTGENFADIIDNGDGSYSCNPIYSDTDPIKVWAFVYTLPPLGGDGVGASVFAGERTFFMLQAPR